AQHKESASKKEMPGAYGGMCVVCRGNNSRRNGGTSVLWVPILSDVLDVITRSKEVFHAWMLYGGRGST
ncbi:hypothetical protein EJB05_49712, partial [Eragrostis curvula]